MQMKIKNQNVEKNAKRNPRPRNSRVTHPFLGRSMEEIDEIDAKMPRMPKRRNQSSRKSHV
jgi:hypothetical protein